VKSNKTRYFIGLGIVAFVLVGIGLTALVGSTSGSSKKTLTGTVKVSLNSYSSVGSSCTGQGGYSDQRAGLKVAVLNTNGKTVATSTLGSGKVDYTGYSCNFDFKVTDFIELEIFGGRFLGIFYNNQTELNFSFFL
jgi:hypothetical protein